MRKNIAVFCASHKGANPNYESAAQNLGQLIATQRRTLLYGGSNFGYMGVVAKAAYEGGAEVVGVIPTIFSDEVIYSQPVSELVKVKNMAERKQLLIERSDAFIALPGGVGTLDEITEVLVANQLHQCDKPIGLLNIDGYYNLFMQLIDQMLSEGLLRPGLERLIFVSSSPEELLAQLDNYGTVNCDQ